MDVLPLTGQTKQHEQYPHEYIFPAYSYHIDIDIGVLLQPTNRLLESIREEERDCSEIVVHENGILYDLGCQQHTSFDLVVVATERSGVQMHELIDYSFTEEIEVLDL